MRRPARNATPRKTGISVTAVPRSGCLAMSRSGTTGEDAAGDQVAGVARPPPVLAEVHRQDQGDHDPAELGRLEVERADRNPPLGAHLGRALDEHEQQQRAERAVQGQRVLGQHAVVERQEDQEGDETDRQRVDLGSDLRAGMAALGRVT